MSKTPNLISYYNIISRSAGYQLPPHLIPVALALEDARIDKLQVIVSPGAGKSQLISIIYPTWLLGNDPSKTIIGISAASDLMTGFVGSAMKIIEFDNNFRVLFPHVQPDKNAGWSSERGFNVTGKPSQLPDASYLGVGINSNAIEGKHCKVMILDDVHSKENASTSAACRAVIDRYHMTLMGRADPGGCRYIVVGRRWLVDDLYGYLERDGEWTTLTLPAERPRSKDLWWDVSVPENKVNIFTEGMGQEVVSDIPGHRKFKIFYGKEEDGFFWPNNIQKKTEYYSNKRSNPYIAKTVYQCSPASSEQMVFKPEDISLTHIPPTIDENTTIVSAWDTANSRNTDSSFSAGIVAILKPCQKWHRSNESLYGECDLHMDVTIVDVFREKFEFDKLYDAIRESHTKWKTDKVIIEDRSSGSNLANVLPNVGVPIERVKATVSKRARAVQAIGGNVASTQGWFQMGRVNILANQPWTNSLVEELLSFDGTGVSDQVDALVHLVNYAISITNRGEVPLVKEPETKVEPLSPVTNFLPATDNISKAEYIRNTFGSARVCGTCSHFSENHCSLRKIACHMFYSCPDYSGVEIY